MLVLAIQFSRIEERNEATAVGGGFVGSRGWSIAPAPRERDQVIGALSKQKTGSGVSRRDTTHR